MFGLGSRFCLFRLGSLLYVWDQVHRCIFKLWFETGFIDVFLGLGPRSSMHFWVWDRVHRCTFGFGTEFIDALLGLGPSSSMHFWVWD